MAVFWVASCETPLPPPPANFDDRFTSADADSDGEISCEELADFMVYHVFHQRDANRDGKLTLQEWWPGADAIERAGFDKRDHNENGTVTLKEARKYARENPVYAQTIQEADADGDGKASWKEVNGWLRRH
jgi:Ca2+-binding EF-hand superfamily protein